MTPDERTEITASVAAHQDLGPDYDKAVAEGLVERIGEEIDKRVDARLRAASRQAPPAASSAPRRHGGFAVILVSLIFGTGATSIVIGGNTSSTAQTVMVLLIWAAIAVINVVYALRR